MGARAFDMGDLEDSCSSSATLTKRPLWPRTRFSACWCRDSCRYCEWATQQTCLGTTSRVCAGGVLGAHLLLREVRTQRLAQHSLRATLTDPVVPAQRINRCVVGVVRNMARCVERMPWVSRCGEAHCAGLTSVLSTGCSALGVNPSSMAALPGSGLVRSKTWEPGQAGSVLSEVAALRRRNRRILMG